MVELHALLHPLQRLQARLVLRPQAVCSIQHTAYRSVPRIPTCCILSTVYFPRASPGCSGSSRQYAAYSTQHTGRTRKSLYAVFCLLSTSASIPIRPHHKQRLKRLRVILNLAIDALGQEPRVIQELQPLPLPFDRLPYPCRSSTTAISFRVPTLAPRARRFWVYFDSKVNTGLPRETAASHSRSVLPPGSA